MECLFFYYFSTDFDWSIGNDFIVSASSDGSYRLWKSSSGKCLRIIADTSGSMANCSCFHSQNGNFLIVCHLHVQYMYCTISDCNLSLPFLPFFLSLSPTLPFSPPSFPFFLSLSSTLPLSFPLSSSSRLVTVRVS